mmetsp:Transcript_19136/g.22139  ORF Transcript_19136/g.22139 Transcript_19136/m.22139 type:complete len:115 (+) Transcript_19136:3-347(+)
MIEIPLSPVYSEDSELTMDENLWQNDEDDERDQRSLTPHPSFEDELQYQSTTISATEFHHLYHASVKADQELVRWPSDENEDDNDISYQKKMTMKKNRKKTKLNPRRHYRVRLV